MAKAKTTDEDIKTTADVPEEVAEAITDAEAAEVVEEKHETKSAKVAKAGKRSAKSLAEAEAEEAKEERKTRTAEQEAEDAEKPKQHQNPTRSRLERQGKNFRKAAELVEKGKPYALREALELATKTSLVKFDATVELHINLNVE